MSPVGDGAKNPEEANIRMAAAAWLPPYVRAAGNFRELCRDSIVTGSPSEELKALGFDSGDGQAALRGIVSDDFLMGTSQLLAPATGVTNFTIYAAIRGAFEADAMICWLLEPGLPALLRGARMLALQLHHEKLNENWVPFKELAAERRQVIHDRATALGLTVEAETVGDQKPPTKTTIFKMLLPDLGDGTEVELGGLLYHIMSGMAHGEEWSSLLEQTAAATAPGAETIAIDINMLNFLLVLVHVLELHERAVCCYGTQFGVETSARPKINSVPWVKDVVSVNSTRFST